MAHSATASWCCTNPQRMAAAIRGYKLGYKQAEKDLALTIEDIRLIIQAFYDTNRIEREAHGEGGLYEFSKTPNYLHQILIRYNYLKYELPQIEQIKSQIP